MDEILNAITLDDIFAEDGPIKDLKDNYSLRQSQLDGAKKIKEALEKKVNFIFEGETGFGKSFAYLVPTIQHIAESGFTKKALIVTSGISLQEQLFFKDIPFVSEVMKTIYPNWPDNWMYTLLKGKQNFLCRNKVNELGLDTMDANMFDDNYKRIQQMLRQTKTGDINELDFVPDSETMNRIACVKKSDCSSKQCPFFNECYYYKHKERLFSSDVIVTNYHMLFSDLKIGGFILPKYDILIFDEAHEAADIYRDFKSYKFSVNTMTNIRNRVSEINNLTDRFKNILSNDYFQNFVKMSEIAFINLENAFPNLFSPKLIKNYGDIPTSFVEDITKISQSVYDKFCDISETQLGIISYIEEGCELTDEEKTEVKVWNIISDLVESVDNILDFVKNIGREVANNNKVIWVEMNNDTISINNKDVDIGGDMANSIFNHEDLTTIFTSATMSVAGSFAYMREQMGLDLCGKEVVEFIGSSPFNLTEQQLWYLPEGAVNGNDPNFEKTIAPHITQILKETHGGALCLFTSIKNMRNAYFEVVSEIGNKLDFYMQGEKPKMQLITKFEENENSVLLGTKSFFTGIDIPGQSLRCLIIDKLPFPQPTDPVQQKLMERDNAFYKYSIPLMIITLKQAIGRGVRSIDDKCVIVILDNRMSTAKYKGRINSSFDYKKTGTRNLSDIHGFLGYDEAMNENDPKYWYSTEDDGDEPF